MRLYKTTWPGTNPILSCHIPKAMGSWLRKELIHGLGPERNFKPIATFIGNPVYDDAVWDRVATEGCDQFSLLEGHFIFDSRASLCSEKCFTVASIRDPVRMLWSLVKYIAKSRGGMDKVSLATIEETHIFDNPICRYFSGFSPERIINESEIDGVIQNAIKNIENKFDFIFIDAHLKSCCNFFNEISGLDISASEKVNVATSESWLLDFNIFKEIILKKYLRYVEHDIKIYNHISDLFMHVAERRISKLLSGINLVENTDLVAGG